MISCSTYMTIVIYLYIYILYIIRSVLRIFSEIGGAGDLSLRFAGLLPHGLLYINVYPYIIYSDE